MSEAGDNARYRAMGFSELIDECKAKDARIKSLSDLDKTRDKEMFDCWERIKEKDREIDRLKKECYSCFRHGDKIKEKDREIAYLRGFIDRHDLSGKLTNETKRQEDNRQ